MTDKRTIVLKELVLFALIILGLSTSAAAEILLVGPRQSQYHSIQAAIDAASNGDEIRIVQGTYFENLIISNKNNLSLFGGYEDESFSSRDPSSNPTVIDGNRNASVIKVYNSTGIIIDGFVMTNGDAQNGGGICANSYSGSITDLTLKNNTITGNSASNIGGGISGFSSLDGGPISLHLDNNIITDNVTPQVPGKGGGGIFLSATSSDINASLLNNTISGNKSNAGAGVFISSDFGHKIDISFYNNYISENDASDNGGAISIASFGVNSRSLSTLEENTVTANSAYTAGGIWGYTESGSLSLTLIKNDFTSNTVASGGGGVNVNTHGGAATLTVNENIFEGNVSGGGGGMIVASHSAGSVTADISGNTFMNNISNGSGGAMSGASYDSGSKTELFLADNLIFGSSATHSGGGIWLYTKSGGNLSLDLDHNTITDNTANWGGGLCGDTDSGQTTVMCQNSIFWGNSPHDTAKTRSKTSVVFKLSHCCLGNELGGYTNLGGNISTNPIFLAPTMGNYHLSPTSPLIDQGQDLGLGHYDIDGDLRPRGRDGFDIGADETDPKYHFAGADFNGDGKTDFAVWRPLNGRWYVKDVAMPYWGAQGDVPVPGDYNGDGVTDIAVWRPSNGCWYVKGIAQQYWGAFGDVPVPGDYNGDGRTDFAVWRPSNGRWYVKDVAMPYWGASGDVPVPGDYNGDGITDFAVWRPSNGKWYIKNITLQGWGSLGDIPVPADYNGDGITDFAVWRPSNGKWYIKDIALQVWGSLGDVPVPGDYNGDGITDFAVWKPSNGRWHILNYQVQPWGTSGDIPLSR